MSIRGNVASQMYIHKCVFNASYPIPRANSEHIGYSLNYFVSDYGAPEHLTYDGAAVQVGRNTNFQKSVRKYKIKIHVSAPWRRNENPVEGAIREINNLWYWIQANLKVQDSLWGYGITYFCETGNLTVNSSIYSNGQTPLEIVTGETPDVSKYLNFVFTVG